MKVPVSVVISAYNEEKKIADCLRSVSWADEIIVVDNESTDKTAAVAKKHGAKVFTRANNLMLNVNKNYGFSKAENEWILSLDADERITEELAEEIKKVLLEITNTPHPSPLPKERVEAHTSSPSRERTEERGMIAGFWIPRKNIIFGKWIMHTGWYPDHQLRLFKKDAGRFAEKHVHEMVEVRGETAYLDYPMVHYNYQTVAQFLHKTMVIYAPNEASELMRKGYVFTIADVIRMPLNEFLSRYFAREGYKDGMHGLVLSLLMAAYHLIVFAYLWEIHGYKEPEKTDITKALEKETRKGYKELLYWFSQQELATITNPVKKMYTKVKGKLQI